MEKSRNSLMLCFSAMLLWFLSAAAGAAGYLYTLSCSPDKYFKGDNELRTGITVVLQSLVQHSSDPGGTEINWEFQYPAADPHVYGGSFCRLPEPEECGRCLRRARKTLLHECDHSAGAEFRSEVRAAQEIQAALNAVVEAGTTATGEEEEGERGKNG
ncbi:unnamed protein product [Linum tenue]|uniref:Gnk2-homologous domain-containing protein n=1 Tax=Linum tenue TaxID=586396 RepID=A0AAV0R989_9ROSI|nr:unnamed protein product [Linum tenue]